MQSWIRLFMVCLLSFFGLITGVFAEHSLNIPILCYHNFNQTKPGSMNLTPQRFEAQVSWLKDNGFHIVPLKMVVDYLQGRRNDLPKRSVVISADDGWQSVYTYMYPIVKKYNIPVTLFIYPQTISSGKHALTWDELHTLENTGLFDVQGHTYSHPNFKQDKKHLSAQRFEKEIILELQTSKNILEKKMQHKIAYLAWPFGIYDDHLKQAAEKAGYDMAFSIDARAANRSFPAMSQPRFMIIQTQTMKTFESIVKQSSN